MSLNKADKNSIAFYYYNKNDKSTLTDGNYQIVGIKDTTLKADLYSYLQEEHMVKLHEYAHLFHEDVNLKPAYFMIPATTVGISFREKSKSRADVFNNPNKSFLQRKVIYNAKICPVVYEVSDINKETYKERIVEVVKNVPA